MKLSDCRAVSGEQVSSIYVRLNILVVSSDKHIWCFFKSVDGAVDLLYRVAEAAVRSVVDHRLSAPSMRIALDSLVHAQQCLYGFMLWSVRDVFVCTSDPDEIEDRAVAVRGKLLDLLQRCLDLGLNESLGRESAPAAVYEKICFLRRETFRVIGDLRILFSNMNAGGSRSLAWSPPMEMVQSMRGVFDAEVAQLQNQLAACGDAKDPKRISEVSSLLTEGLLYPLSQVMVIDVENLNRRQGAAILNFIVHESEGVTELVKIWTKKLKDRDPIKYLEVQMVALKNSYSENVYKHMSFLKEADQIESQANFSTADVEQLEAALDAGSEVMHQFGKAISQTLGVGKLKSESAQALVRFFKAGIDFAFTEPETLAFLSVMEIYLRFLTNNLQAEVADYLSEMINSSNISERVVDILDQDLRSAPARHWSTKCLRAYNSFADSLSRRTSIGRSNLDISAITRFSEADILDHSRDESYTKPVGQGSKRGSRLSYETSLSALTAATVAKKIADEPKAIPAPSRAYGTKRRRSSSLSSDLEGDFLEHCASNASSVTQIKAQPKQVAAKLFESSKPSSSRDNSQDNRQDSEASSSRGKRGRVSNESGLATRRSLRDDSSESPEEDTPTLKKAKGSSTGASSKSSRSKVASDSSGNNDMNTDFAYGLHIEDVFETASGGASQLVKGRRSIESQKSSSKGSRSKLSANPSSILFGDSGDEDDELTSAPLPPSTRNRNR